jgi:hypothetical protein
MMNAALTARLVAAGRVGFGVALILTPGRVTAPWLGRDSGRAGTRVLSRGLGARDVALGVSALAVSEPPTASVGGGDPRRHGGPSRHAGRGRLATTRRQGTCGRRGVPGVQSSAASPWQGCGLACVALDRSGLDALSPAAASTAAEHRQASPPPPVPSRTSTPSTACSPWRARATAQSQAPPMSETGHLGSR